jgi:hypothetical protein
MELHVAPFAWKSAADREGESPDVALLRGMNGFRVRTRILHAADAKPMANPPRVRQNVPGLRLQGWFR